MIKWACLFSKRGKQLVNQVIFSFFTFRSMLSVTYHITCQVAFYVLSGFIVCNTHAGLIRDTEGHDFCLRKIFKMAVKYSKWPSWLFPDFQIKI